MTSTSATHSGSPWVPSCCRAATIVRGTYSLTFSGRVYYWEGMSDGEKAQRWTLRLRWMGGCKYDATPNFHSCWVSVSVPTLLLTFTVDWKVVNERTLKWIQNRVIFVNMTI